MSTLPPLSFYFKAEFDLPDATSSDVKFMEASGMSREVENITVAEGGENRFLHKLPGRANYPNLILKRGLMMDTALRDWFHDAIYDFDIKPITVWLKLLNQEGLPLQTFTFYKAWPKKWSISDFKSTSSDLVIESVELCYQYFEIIE